MQRASNLFPILLRTLFLLSLLLISKSSHSQLTKIWELNAQGDHLHPLSYGINRNPYLKSFPAADGDFIVVSLNKSGDTSVSRTIYLFRHDAEGNLVWEYTYPSPYGIEENFEDIVSDASGNIIIAGKTTTELYDPFEPVESSNTLLMKISPLGQLLWARESNPAPIRGVQNSTGVTTDPDGNIYTASTLIGQDGGIPLIQKWSPDGLLIWERLLNKNFYNASVERSDSTIFILRSGNPSTIFHYSLDGEFLFEGDGPKISGLKPVFDHQGNWYSFPFSGDFSMLKLDIYGDTLWTYHKLTNLPSNVTADELIDCYIDADENVYVTGRYYGPHYGDTSRYTNCDILTAKINAAGEVQWENIYRFDQTRSCQVGERILVDGHGNTFVAGYQSVRIGADPFASEDMVVLVYDAFGNRIDSSYYNGPLFREDIGVNFVLDDDALYLYGWSQQGDQLFDPVVIKYSNLYTSTTRASSQHPFTIYPNPVVDGKLFFYSDQEILSVDIYDMMGRMMLTDPDVANKSFIDLGPDFPSGVFIVSIQTEKGLFAQPIVIR